MNKQLLNRIKEVIKAFYYILGGFLLVILFVTVSYVISAGLIHISDCPSKIKDELKHE